MPYMEMWKLKSSLSGVKRFSNVIYLADWKHALLYDGSVFTDIVWQHVPCEASNDRMQTFYDRLITQRRRPLVSASGQEAIDYAVNGTGDLTGSKLIHLVKSTYPVMVSNCWGTLDLKASVKAYKDFKNLHHIDYIFKSS